MRWWDRLLGRPLPPESHEDEQAQDEAALRDLRSSFRRVHARADRIERELLRINEEYRRKQGLR